MVEKNNNLKITTIYKSNFRQAAVMLREIADYLEGFESQGQDVEVALVLRTDEVKVFGLGAADAGSTHILLAYGQRAMENAVLRNFDLL